MKVFRLAASLLKYLTLPSVPDIADMPIVSPSPQKKHRVLLVSPGRNPRYSWQTYHNIQVLGEDNISSARETAKKYKRDEITLAVITSSGIGGQGFSTPPEDLTTFLDENEFPITLWGNGIPESLTQNRDHVHTWSKEHATPNELIKKFADT